MNEYRIRNYDDLRAYKANVNNQKIKGFDVKIELKNFNKIEDINFNHAVELICDELDRNVSIKDVTFSNGFLIGGLEVSEGVIGLRFEGCEFKKEFRFDDRNEAPLFDILTFDYCKFHGSLNIIGANLSQLNFLGNIQTNNFLTELNGENSYINSSKIKELSFTGMKINGGLTVKGNDFDKISFSSIILNGKIFIESIYKSLNFTKLYLDTQDEINKGGEIFVRILKELNKSKIIFSDIVKLDNVRIYGENSNTIGEISIDHINWKFNFFNFKVNSLKIQNSNLKDSEFNSLKIISLYLINSVIQDSIFYGNIFPKNYKIESGKLSKYQIKDNYRQLKFVMDKNGNYTDGNKFYSKEMEAYMRTLDIKYTSSFSLIKELYSDNFLSKKAQITSEKVSLIASYIINDFGNNWLRALQGLLLLALSATLISGLANLIGNYTTIILFIVLLIVPKIKATQKILGKIFDNKKIKLYNSYIDYKMGNLTITLIAFLILFLLIEVGIKTKGEINYSIFRTFGDYINPIFTLRDFVVHEGVRIYVKISWIENLSFVLYKILYGIVLWHLIVAAKRTTKR